MSAVSDPRLLHLLLEPRRAPGGEDGSILRFGLIGFSMHTPLDLLERGGLRKPALLGVVSLQISYHRGFCLFPGFVFADNLAIGSVAEIPHVFVPLIGVRLYRAAIHRLSASPANGCQIADMLSVFVDHGLDAIGGKGDVIIHERERAGRRLCRAGWLGRLCSFRGRRRHLG